MLIPHRNLQLAAALWLASGIAAIWLSPLLVVWQVGGALLAVVALADAWLVRAGGQPLAVARRVAQIWPVGSEQTIRLRLSGAPRRLCGQLYDHHPDAFAAVGLPLDFEVPRGGWAELSYRVHASARGEHAFGRVALRIASPFRLWFAQHDVDAPMTVHVYPDFARVTQYALLATDNRLSQLGVLRRRRRGEGLDFEQLREYRRDDSTRRIDWKATARVRKPIVREYQDERDQQIVFLLDCGQRMRSRDEVLSHFDHTLNAMLLLSYVALRQGDAVGFATFAHPAPRFFPPRKTATVQALLKATFDLQPSLHTPDYLVASQLLCSRLRKRSLVILLTNLRDEDDTTLQPALAQLRSRHLVLVASLRETGLDLLLHQPVAGFDDALSYAAAVDYRQARQTQLSRLRAHGVSVLDTDAPQLPVALVNRYWDMKRSGTI